jgi:hypothetical protein
LIQLNATRTAKAVPLIMAETRPVLPEILSGRDWWNKYFKEEKKDG